MQVKLLFSPFSNYNIIVSGKNNFLLKMSDNIIAIKKKSCFVIKNLYFCSRISLGEITDMK